jgi:hypothetical protein
MWFKDIVLIFSPREVKEAYGILYEIDRELDRNLEIKFGGAWAIIRYRIEQYLILHTKSFLNSIKEKKLSPREIVYNIIYNESAEEIEIGDPFITLSNGYEQLNKFITKKINRMKFGEIQKMR